MFTIKFIKEYHTPIHYWDVEVNGEIKKFFPYCLIKTFTK